MDPEPPQGTPPPESRDVLRHSPHPLRHDHGASQRSQWHQQDGVAETGEVGRDRGWSTTECEWTSEQTHPRSDRPY